MKIIYLLGMLILMGCMLEGRISYDATLEIPGAAISSKEEAKSIAFKEYLKHRSLALDATENLQVESVVKLGYSIPDFAKTGEALWELKVYRNFNEMIATIWLNPNTKQIYIPNAEWLEPHPKNEDCEEDKQ